MKKKKTKKTFQQIIFHILVSFELNVEITVLGPLSVTSKKLPNAYKSSPKLISIEKSKILTPLHKLPNNVGDLGKIIVARGFKMLPKVQ